MLWKYIYQRKKGVPAFDHFSKYVFAAGTAMVRGVPASVNSAQLLMWSYGLINLLINFVVVATYHSRILHMEPGGCQYCQWVGKTLMYLFLPTLRNILTVNRTDAFRGLVNDND